MTLIFCPRCTCRSFEVLRSHSHCVNCNYSPTLEEDYKPEVPDWALNVIRESWELGK